MIEYHEKELQNLFKDTGRIAICLKKILDILNKEAREDVILDNISIYYTPSTGDWGKYNICFNARMK